MARYAQAFKDRAVARLLPPQSAALDSGGAQGWCWSGNPGALARRCAVQSRPRPGLDCGRPVSCRDFHRSDERCGQERLVPPARRVSGRSGQGAGRWHHRVGPSRGPARQSPGHACPPQAHQETRARAAAQKPGTGGDGAARHWPSASPPGAPSPCFMATAAPR